MNPFVNHLIGQVGEHNDFEKAKRVLKAMATIILASLASEDPPAKKPKRRAKKKPAKKASKKRSKKKARRK